jgi:TRAP-type transport system small permease protein
VGIVFAVSTGLILLNDLYRAVTGQLSEADLVMVKESEEQEELEALQRELAERDRRELGEAPVAPAATKNV